MEIHLVAGQEQSLEEFYTWAAAQSKHYEDVCLRMLELLKHLRMLDEPPVWAGKSLLTLHLYDGDDRPILVSVHSNGTEFYISYWLTPKEAPWRGVTSEAREVVDSGKIIIDGLSQARRLHDIVPTSRIVRPATLEERERHAKIRKEIVEEFPPAGNAGRQESPPGIPAQIRQAREAQSLTWYALAKLAEIPNANTVRDIEYGRDAQISSVQAVAKALGLRLELVEEKV